MNSRVKLIRTAPACIKAYLLANLAAKSKGRERSSVETTLIEVADIDLHTAMVLGSDELVSPRAAK
jgi:hypothetical protein